MSNGSFGLTKTVERHSKLTKRTRPPLLRAGDTNAPASLGGFLGDVYANGSRQRVVMTTGVCKSTTHPLGRGRRPIQNQHVTWPRRQHVLEDGRRERRRRRRRRRLVVGSGVDSVLVGRRLRLGTNGLVFFFGLTPPPPVRLEISVALHHLPDAALVAQHVLLGGQRPVVAPRVAKI